MGRLIRFTDISFCLDDSSGKSPPLQRSYQPAPEEITSNLQSIPGEETSSQTHDLAPELGIALQRHPQASG